MCWNAVKRSSFYFEWNFSIVFICGKLHVFERKCQYYSYQYCWFFIFLFQMLINFTQEKEFQLKTILRVTKMNFFSESGIQCQYWKNNKLVLLEEWSKIWNFEIFFEGTWINKMIRECNKLKWNDIFLTSIHL